MNLNTIMCDNAAIFIVASITIQQLSWAQKEQETMSSLRVRCTTDTSYAELL